MTTTTTTRTTRTIRVYLDPNEYGLAWDEPSGSTGVANESGAYGEDEAADNEQAGEQLRTLLREVIAAGLTHHMDWDDGGCLTVTGPADHPILTAAR